MGAYVWPVDAVAGSPSYTGRMLRQIFGVLFGGGIASRPLVGRSGVNPRTPSTTVAVVTSPSLQWVVHAHSGYVDAETSASAGGYSYSFDTDQSGAINAADATNPRIDLISVQISDPAESDGSSVPSVAVVYTAGVPAASPSVPATPARSIALAQINVPKTGSGTPTASWVARRTVAAGGVIPVSGTSQYPTSPYKGQMIYDEALDAVLKWNGTAWTDVLATDTGWLSDTGAFTPVSGQSIVSAQYRRVGSVVSIIVNFTAPTINAGVTGNVPNTAVFTITDPRFIPSQGGQALSAGGTGQMASYTVSAGGVVTFDATSPNVDVAAGATLTCAGVYLV